MPAREELARNRYLAPIAHRFLSPELWRFTRRSVPRGLALGFFCAFIVPIGQIFLAAFMALPFRANVPLAAAATFVTNPFTFPFWIVVANRVGDAFIDLDAVTGAVVENVGSERWQQVAALFELAGVTAFGFVVLAVLTSLLSWIVSKLVWRWLVARKRARRLGRMERALNERLARKGLPTP